MDSLIQDVLTIGKLDSVNSGIQPEWFSFSNLVDDLIQTLSSTVLKDRKIEVRAETAHDKLYLDPNLIDLITRNLLENAGKYSFMPEKIIFSYSITDTDLDLECQDFGIGIPEKDQKDVFESFIRGTNTDNIKGTGLGLPIVKKSVERMGGTIKLKSVVDEGTTVSVNIPLSSNQ
jgi:K+-sensing histidine kinase KdpD